MTCDPLWPDSPMSLITVGVGGEWRMRARDRGVETDDGNGSEMGSVKKKVPRRVSVNVMVWD